MSRYYLLGILLVGLLSSTQAQEYVRGTLISSPPPVLRARALSTATTTVHTCDGRRGSACSSDCATLLTCVIGRTEPAASFLCSSLSAATPYCNEGASGCSATPTAGDPNCPAPRPDFECTAIGYFPQPKNCSQYAYCSDSSGAEIYECPPGYVYNSPREMCKQHVYFTDCATIDCNNQIQYPVFLQYSEHKAFYALCTQSMNGIANTPLMLRCDDTENMEFNFDTYSCEFKCLADGLYPDNLDVTCKTYYECYTSGWTFLSNHKACPTGLEFDTNKNNCVVAAKAVNKCSTLK